MSWRHDFWFSGTCVDCGDPTPHIPHVLEKYGNRKQYEKFCLGRSGNEPGDPMIVRTFWPGHDGLHDYSDGYWYRRG